jgi:hypothetical protein
MKRYQTVLLNKSNGENERWKALTVTQRKSEKTLDEQNFEVTLLIILHVKDIQWETLISRLPSDDVR